MTHYKVDSNIDRKDEPYDAMGDFAGIEAVKPQEDPEPSRWRGRIVFAVELLLGLLAAIGIMLWLLYVSQGG